MICIWFCACGSASEKIELAKQNVERFHSQFNSAEYGAIYASTDEKVRVSRSQTDFTNYLQSVHDRLGNVQSCSLLRTAFAWHTTQRATITLVYETSFAKGVGREQFIWQIDENQVSLYRYTVN